MKKLLLGTSALVAAGLFSNGALAQTATTDQPVQMKIGGQYYAGIGDMIAQDDNPGESAYKRNPISVQEYFLIRFIGSTTFSNGITAGVWTRLNAFSAPNATASSVSGFQSSNNTTIKDSYVFLKNAPVWGELRLGDDTDVRRNFAVGGSGVSGDGNVSANSPALQWTNSPVYNFTTWNLDARATKIEYFSPTIAGFQFGVSFAPDKAGGHSYGPGNDGDNNGLTDRITNGLTASYDNSSTAYNYWSAGATWTGTFGPTKIQTSLAYSTASRKCAVNANLTTALGTEASATNCSILGSGGTQNADPKAFNAGLQADYGPFSLGVNYEQTVAVPGAFFGIGQATAFNSAGAVTTTVVRTNEMVNKQVDFNLSYTIGAIKYGTEYSRGAFEGITGDADVKRAAINNEIQLYAAYQVGPGVQIAGIVQQEDYDPNGKYIALSGGASNVYAKGFDSTALIFETQLKF